MLEKGQAMTSVSDQCEVRLRTRMPSHLSSVATRCCECDANALETDSVLPRELASCSEVEGSLEVEEAGG